MRQAPFGANQRGPFAYETYAGRAFLREVFAKYGAREKQELVAKVISEFQPRPSAIVLPDGLAAKPFEGERLARIACKLVRGLYFHEPGEFLPEYTPHRVDVVPPNRPSPKLRAESPTAAPGRRADRLAPRPVLARLCVYRSDVLLASHKWPLSGVLRTLGFAMERSGFGQSFVSSSAPALVGLRRVTAGNRETP